MAVFTGLGAGTEIDPFQITTVTQFKSMNNWAVVAWFKIMNNIDFTGLSGLDASFNIDLFTSHLDGNSKEIQNITVGNNAMYGFNFKDGCSMKNLTFRVTTSVNNEADVYRVIFGLNGGIVNNVNFSDIKVITSGTGSLSFFSMQDWAASCTIKNIVFEGFCGQIFRGSVYGVMENVKVLRLNNINISASQLAAPIIGGTLYGEMKYCQAKILKYDFAGGNNNVGFLVATLGPAGIITQCFVDGDITATGTAAGNVTNGMAGVSSATIPGHTSSIQDSYFKGKFTATGSTGQIKSYMAAESAYVSITRCLVNVNLISSLNNRPVFTLATNVKSTNNFYNKAPMMSFTAVDVAGRQTGLTGQQFTEAVSFTGFDFGAVWIMTAGGPELRNNPPYNFETSLKSLTITSYPRLTGTAFSIVLNPVEVANYGVEVYDGQTLVFAQADTLVNVVPVPLLDRTYTISPYYFNSVKVYQANVSYIHYAYDMAIAVATVVAVTAKAIFSAPTPADLIHGSLIHNGFIYGSTRGFYGTNPGAIIKAPVHNIAAFNNIEIRSTPLTNAEIIAAGKVVASSYMQNMDQIVLCDGYIYTLGDSVEDGYKFIIQLNTIDDSYKIFRTDIISPSEPIITDGKYLYFSNSVTDKLYKVLASQFIGDFPKFNTAENFTIVISDVYDMTTQGGHIAGGYASNLKGLCHSGITDDQFLYIAFTTDAFTSSGYYAPLDISTNELHKVRKSDMTAAGFVKIPKSTDDCSQNKTHIFYGIEIQSSADPRAYGYGWGGYAVRKSDLKLTGLPRYDINDISPVTTSYGSLIFGHYLIDIKTNRRTYVLDVSDVDNWTTNEPIGKRLVKTFMYSGLGTGILLNEILLDSDNTFYGFGWSSPSSLMEFTLPGLDFFAAPTITTMEANITDPQNIILSGFVINTGGQPITEKGFKYGLSAGELTNTITSAENTPEFHAVLSGLAGTSFYKAYAINANGESAAEIKTFTVGSQLPIFYGGVRIAKILLNNSEIKFN
jgi:hypothetical protein